MTATRRIVLIVAAMLTVFVPMAEARVYDAEAGRWLRRDPLGYVDGMSRYQYARSMPMVRVDPSGQKSIDRYGNWCGKGWGNGDEWGDEDSLPYPGTPGFVRPIDCLDDCCYYHDHTMFFCRSVFAHDSAKEKCCRKKGDRALSNCVAKNVRGKGCTGASALYVAVLIIYFDIASAGSEDCDLGGVVIPQFPDPQLPYPSPLYPMFPVLRPSLPVDSPAIPRQRPSNPRCDPNLPIEMQPIECRDDPVMRPVEDMVPVFGVSLAHE